MLCSKHRMEFGAAPYKQDFFGFMILKKMGPWVKYNFFLGVEIFKAISIQKDYIYSITNTYLGIIFVFFNFLNCEIYITSNLAS